MRIEQLIYLVEVVESGTFTAAANKLHVAQPSISQAIAALEAELGTDLLQRMRNGVKLTPTGEIVINHAKSILIEIDEISKAHTNTMTKRTISIVSTSAPLATFLPSAATTIQNTFTNCAIKITEGSPRFAERAVERNEADFAIIPYVENHKFDNQHLSFKPILVAHLMALVNKSCALASKNPLMLQDVQP